MLNKCKLCGTFVIAHKWYASAVTHVEWWLSLGVTPILSLTTIIFLLISCFLKRFKPLDFSLQYTICKFGCLILATFSENFEMAEDISQILETNLKNIIRSDRELDNVSGKVEASVLESPKCKRDFDSSQSELSTEKSEGETEPKKALFG